MAAIRFDFSSADLLRCPGRGPGRASTKDLPAGPSFRSSWPGIRSEQAWRPAWRTSGSPAGICWRLARRMLSAAPIGHDPRPKGSRRPRTRPVLPSGRDRRTWCADGRRPRSRRCRTPTISWVPWRQWWKAPCSGSMTRFVANCPRAPEGRRQVGLRRDGSSSIRGQGAQGGHRVVVLGWAQMSSSRNMTMAM